MKYIISEVHNKVQDKVMHCAHGGVNYEVHNQVRGGMHNDVQCTRRST